MLIVLINFSKHLTLKANQNQTPDLSKTNLKRSFNNLVKNENLLVTQLPRRNLSQNQELNLSIDLTLLYQRWLPNLEVKNDRLETSLCRTIVYQNLSKSFKRHNE